MNWFLIFVCVLFFIALGNAEAAEAVVSTVTAPPVTLQDSLVSIITSVQSGVQAGVSFLQAEIPDVVRQLLMWHMTRSTIIAISLLALATGIIWGFFRILKWSKRDGADYNDEVGPIVYGIFGGIILLVVIGVFYDNFLTALQIWVAPKVWLIEYAASLVK